MSVDSSPTLAPAHPLTLGDPQMDREHATLWELAEALRDAPDDQAIAPLDALREHAALHFAAEDADLRRFGGPDHECHLDEHAAVLRSLAEVRDILAGPGRPGLGQHLATELLRWLPEHVHAMDAGVAASRSKQRFGGAPLVLHRKTPKADPA